MDRYECGKPEWGSEPHQIQRKGSVDGIGHVLPSCLLRVKSIVLLDRGSHLV